MAEVLTHSTQAAAHEPEGNYLTENTGFKNWALTVDHKRIGLMYFWTIMAMFFVGGVLALAELLWGSWRLIVAFAVGHVGATLLVAVGLTAVSAAFNACSVVHGLPSASGKYSTPRASHHFWTVVRRGRWSRPTCSRGWRRRSRRRTRRRYGGQRIGCEAAALC